MWILTHKVELPPGCLYAHSQGLAEAIWHMGTGSLSRDAPPIV